MNELEKAKVKDKILRFLLRNRNCEQYRLYIALDRPTREIDDFFNLALEMYRDDHKYFKIQYLFGKVTYDKTELTAIFIKNGGFTGIIEN